MAWVWCGRLRRFAEPPEPVCAGGAPGAGKPRAGGGITLRLLIEEGILSPGENVLTVEYKSSMTYATLMPDGRIACSVSHCPQ